MTTLKALGCSDNSFSALENAVLANGGKKFTYRRTYALLSNWQGQDPVVAAGMGYRAVASIKPKHSNAFVSLTDIIAGKIDNELIAMMDRLLSAPGPNSGNHVFAGWHEPDTFLAKGGTGTPDQVDQAVAHILTLFINRPAYAKARWDVSLTLTGYQFLQRVAQYPRAIAVMQSQGVRGILAVDSPYTVNPEQNIGPALDYITLHWPKQRVQIHECGRDIDVVGGQTRQMWFTAFSKALMTKRYDLVDAVCYWNSADVAIAPSDTPTVQSLATFQRDLQTMPPPPAPPTTAVPNSELSALTAAAKGVGDAKAVLDAAQVAYDDAVTALTTAATAVVTP